MTGADVAYQQALAAWISAGAALVQAIGAIAAIFVAIQLARSSAERERQAEDAAARRLEEADRAQQARDAAADRAAEERIERGKAETHNGLIDRVSSLAILAADQCRTEINQARSSYADVYGTIISEGFVSKRLAELREALPQQKAETGHVELLEAISVLQDRTAPERIEVIGGANYVSVLEGKLENLFGAIAAIEGLRR